MTFDLILELYGNIYLSVFYYTPRYTLGVDAKMYLNRPTDLFWLFRLSTILNMSRIMRKPAQTTKTQVSLCVYII